MRHSPHFSLEQSFPNIESKASYSNKIKQDRETIGESISKVKKPFNASEVSSTGRISSLFNEYTLKIGNSPLTEEEHQMSSSRGAQGFFRNRTPQSHDAHKERLHYPICTDNGKLISSHTTCDTNKKHHVKLQPKRRPLEPAKQPNSCLPESVLDEISEIDLPLECLDSSLLPSEASFFSVPQTLMEPVHYSVGLDNKSFNFDDPDYDIKSSGEGRKVKEHSKLQNQVGTTPVGMGKAPLPTRGKQQLKVHTRPKLPASYQEWVEGVMEIATHVWMPLGLFAFQLTDSESPLNAAKGTIGEPTKTVHDSENDGGFAHCLWDFYSHAMHEETRAYTKITWISNGLWRLLFNTVLYCLSLHDLHQGAVNDTDPDSEVGAHEVGCASGTSGQRQPPSLVPAPLSWTKTTPSRPRSDNPIRPREDLSWQREQDPTLSCGLPFVNDKLPNDVAKVQLPSTQDRCPDGVIHDSLKASDLNALSSSYAERLRVPLSVLDWCLLIRCLAQMGYTRDQFYVQTPTQASPDELLLAMLWLTKQYQLISVVEYVEMNRRFPFLLRYHATKNDNEDTPLLDTASSMSQERLLFSFSKSAVWPPESFDESATIAHRLRQIERILGAEGFERRTTSSVAHQRQHRVEGVSKVILRRVLAAQNLIQMSLNRLKNALQQRNEQVSVLGPHSYLDAQLCTYEHHNLYVRIVEGLYHLLAMEKRVLQRSRSLCAAGLLVSFLITQRGIPTHTSDLDVIESLEGDAVSWLADELDTGQSRLKEHDKIKMSPSVRRSEAVRRGQMRYTASCQACGVDGEGCRDTEMLSHTISQFRAARLKEHLSNLWKLVVRRTQINTSPGISPSNSLYPDDSTVWLSDEARERIGFHVNHHIDRHYSLHAALAAELLILQCQHEEQIRNRQGINTPGVPHRRGNKISALPFNTSGISLDVPLFFTTTISTPPTDLSGEAVSISKGKPLGECDIQLLEIGCPTPGSTTSATVEFERISQILGEINQESERQRDERIAYSRESINQLRRDFNLRLLTKVDQG